MAEQLPSRPAIAPKVTVIGDVILDRYTWGETTRISPEAPIPVLQVDQDDVRLGGAANVAMQLSALEANVDVIGVVGEDTSATTLRHLLSEQKIDSSGLIVDPVRPTSCKQRFLGRASGRHTQQILRVDQESTASISETVEQHLWDHFEDTIADSAAVLIADYGKGICTESLLHRTIERCQEQGVPVLIDPAAKANVSRYAGATLLKPNRIEAEFILQRSTSDFESHTEMAQELFQQCDVTAVALTLDRDGIVVADGEETIHLPTSAQEVYDITGAGDVVLAALGYGLASGWSLEESARLGNLAAGIQVSKLGAETVTWNEILCQDRSMSSTQKISSLPEVLAATREAQRTGRKVVFTNGCFDLFHVGHLQTLQAAANEGDLLVVGINSDSSVQRLKGSLRPIVPETQRAEIIAGFAEVDFVLIYNDETPHRLLNALQPDVLFKGATTEEVVGAEIVEGYGGRVVLMEQAAPISTTDLVKRIF